MPTALATWDTGSGPLMLEQGEVHVWRAWLNAQPAQIGEFENLLCDDERHRAARYRFAVHKNRFVERRATLRTLLGQYLQIAAADIELEYSRFGKPYLAPRLGTDIRFSASHSQDLALIALTRSREAGVDIERVLPDFSDHAVPERFFSPREAAALRAQPIHRQREAFFEIWVRKEAYVKATGMGLSLALDSFEVSLGDPATIQILRDPPDSSNCGIWSIAAFRPAPDYTAALVVEGRECSIHFKTWLPTTQPNVR